MTVYKLKHESADIPKRARVIALGFFDGVHIGHREIIRTARAEADALGASLAIFTFPSETEGIKRDVGRLGNTEEKLRAFSECGADEVLLTDFDDVCGTAAPDFVHDFLIDRCCAVACVTGEDYRFGRGAEGNVALLDSLMRESGGRAVTVPDVTVDGVRVSTGAIKEALRRGDTGLAERMLGSPYTLRGRVERGRGVGHTLGYPTVNLPLGISRGVLRRGVYYSRVTLGGITYPAVTNVGTCPTFGSHEEHLESFIIGFEGDAYGDGIVIELGTFLRDEVVFSSENELKMQINIDINRALKENF